MRHQLENTPDAKAVICPQEPQTGVSGFVCCSAGGTAPNAPAILKQPSVRVTHPLSDVGHCQISREGFGAVCAVLKLESRKSQRRLY